MTSWLYLSVGEDTGLFNKQILFGRAMHDLIAVYNNFREKESDLEQV